MPMRSYPQFDLEYLEKVVELGDQQKRSEIR